MEHAFERFGVLPLGRPLLESIPFHAMRGGLTDIKTTLYDREVVFEFARNDASFVPARLPLVLIPLLQAVILTPRKLPHFRAHQHHGLQFAPNFWISLYESEDHVVFGGERPHTWLHNPPTWDFQKILSAVKSVSPMSLALGAQLYREFWKG